MKSRDEMLQFLHSIPVGAQATVATMDMGLEYEYVTKDGHGGSFGNMGDWPAHIVHNIPQERIETIKQKIADGVLQLDDIKNTGLEDFYDYVFGVERFDDYNLNLSEFFEGMTKINHAKDDTIYILCDGRQWEPEAFFFDTYDELSEAFISDYVGIVDESWDDLSDEELEEWVDHIEQELSEIALNVWGDDEDEF